MKQSLRLARIMILGNGLASFGGDSSRKSRRFGKAGNFLLFILLFAYMGGIISVSTNGLYRVLEPLALQQMIVPLYLSVAVAIAFFFGAVYSISIFYYSSDIEKLLPLPLRAEEIISAKQLVTAAYVELFIAALVAPGLIVYGVLSAAVWYYYPLVVLIVLVLPLIPLCLASVLVMLLMRLTPFARNKDRFNMFSGMLVMVVSLAVLFLTQSMGGRSGLDMAAMIEQSADNITGITSAVFPGTYQAAIVLQNLQPTFPLLELALLLLFAASAWLIMILVGRTVYFRGVIGLSSSSGHRRTLSVQDLARASRPGKAWMSYMIKDLRILFRTPIYFMNCVLMNFLWPVFLCIPLFTGPGGPLAALREFRQLGAGIRMDSGIVLVYIACITFGVSAFVAGTNGITASALSREGRLLYVMKMIPMSYNQQILAKISAGVALGLAGTLMTLLLAIILVLPPFWLILVLLPVLPGAIVLPSFAGIVFDLLWPKLKWDNEQKAVKQNLNVLLGMLTSMLLIALTIGPVVLIQPAWAIALLLLVVIPWAFIGGLMILIRKIGPRCLLEIEA